MTEVDFTMLEPEVQATILTQNTFNKLDVITKNSFCFLWTQEAYNIKKEKSRCLLRP